MPTYPFDIADETAERKALKRLHCKDKDLFVPRPSIPFIVSKRLICTVLFLTIVTSQCAPFASLAFILLCDSIIVAGKLLPGASGNCIRSDKRLGASGGYSCG